ncbi:unnamed protein product [Blepharisma stoltei]|uniref:Uncharacterized protein n=1 Tax=Blepharisma stoltei TaxID=1481888 RepID=A0AAU9K866_9CILI|nr:unnamed protein product [Blepharisma stoltei]
MLLFPLKRAIHQLFFVSRNISTIRFSSRFYSTNSSPIERSWSIEQPRLTLPDFINYCDKRILSKADFSKTLKNLDKEIFKNICEEEAFFISRAIVRLFSKDIPIDAIKNFEEAVVGTLKNYNSDSQEINGCLNDIMKMHKFAFIPANHDFENEYLEYLNKSFKPTKAIYMIYAITNLVQKPQDINKYKTVYQSLAKLISIVDLTTLQDKYLSTLLSSFALAYSYLNKAASFEMKSGEDLFDEIEKIVLLRIEAGGLNFEFINEYTSALNSIDKASKNLIMSWSKSLTASIDNLEDQDFMKSFFTAINVNFEDDFQKNSIQKLLFENLLKRLNRLKLKDFRNAFRFLGSEVFYVDERLNEAFKDYIKGEAFLSLKINEKVEKAIILMTSLWNLLENYDTELLETLKKICCESYSELQIMNKLKLAAFFSTSKDLTEGFWKKFIDEVHLAFNNDFTYNYLYAINLNLLGTPYYEEYHQKIQSIYEVLEQSWKAIRENGKSFTNWTHTHDIVNNYLLSKNIDFQKNYFHYFYFDFAIPQTKKLIKINQVHDYTFPAKFLKRYNDLSISFQAKTEWKIIYISSINTTDQEVSEKLQSILDS